MTPMRPADFRIYMEAFSNVSALHKNKLRLLAKSWADRWKKTEQCGRPRCLALDCEKCPFKDVTLF